MRKFNKLFLLLFVFLTFVNVKPLKAQGIAYQTLDMALVGSVIATFQCADYEAYRLALLRTDYVECTISTSINSTVHTCTNPTNVMLIANALRTATAATIVDGSNTWIISLACGSSSFGVAVELTVNNGGACLCGTMTSLRPCIGTTVNWGGVGGNPCPPSSQTITLKFGYPSSGGPTLPPIANFFQGVSDTTAGPMDTVWINSPQTIVNTSSNQSRVYWDIEQYVPTGDTTLNGGYFRQNVKWTAQRYIDTSKYKNNLNYTFDKRGWWKLRLLAVNFLKSDSLRDSITKYIWVDTPSRAPRANFITFKKIVGFADQSSFIDLSDNGPNQWQWDYFPPCNKCSIMPFAPNYFDPYNTVANPKFTGFDPGIYTICLRVWNARGTDSVCKTDYIKVVNGYNMCSGTGSFGSSDAEGYIYGPSGPNFSYTRSQVGGCPGFLINPCADSITLYVERIKMLPSDSLQFFNGFDATAPKIATIGASAGGQLPLPNNKKTIRSGIAVFVKFKLGTTGVPNPYDSAGFVIRWDMKPASYPKPTASFTAPDTIYNGTPTLFTNTSVGTLMKYSWDTDGNNMYDSVSMNPFRSFNVTIPSIRKICLVSYNCIGVDTFCKNIVFLPVTSPPIARFEANKVVGFNTDTFNLIDKSLNGPSSWRWSFMPTSVQYLAGTPTSQFPRVRFTSAVSYTIKLVACNALGCDSMTRSAYISVTAYPTPSSLSDLASIGNGSMGISRVSLSAIDTTFPNAVGPGYQMVVGNQSANLFRGVKYILSMYRPNDQEFMDRKAWIDFNMNAGFESNETIINERNARTVVRRDTFMIPNNQTIGNTRLRLAIDIGNSTLNPVSATLGMFKDFTLYFPRDTIKPQIQLNGSAGMSTEIHKAFAEPGVTAFDNWEGDISSKYECIGTVDTSVVGPNSLKYIVRDLYGNVSDTLYRTVFVELNQTGPSITLTGASIIVHEVNTAFSEPGYVAKDNVGNDITSNVVVVSTLNVSRIGNYVISYTITDAFGFFRVATRIIQVRDRTAPVIASISSNPYKHQVRNIFDPLSVVTVGDNYDTKPVISYVGVIDVNNVGSYFIRYSAIDSSGNKSPDFLLEVQVNDIVPPTVQLNGSPNDKVEVYNNYVDPWVQVNDNYWPKNSIQVIRKGTVDVSKLGRYYLWYIATDGSGNSDSVMRQVEVVKTSLPVIRLLGQNPLNMRRFCQYSEPGVRIEDAHYTDTLNSAIRNLLVIDASNVRNDEPGIYYVTYNLTDPLGNKAATVQRSVNISDENCNTAIADVFEENFNVYPVPSTGILYLDLKSELKVQSIKVYNILGQEVKTFEGKVMASGKAILDISNLAAGMYNLRIQTTNNKEFGKAVLLQK